MDSEFNKPGSSKDPQPCIVYSDDTCAQEEMQMKSVGCKGSDNEQKDKGSDNINEGEETCSLSSDDSEIFNHDDVNVMYIKNGSDEAASVNVSEASGKDAEFVLNPKHLRQVVDKSEGLKKVLFKNHFMAPITFLLLLHDFGMELKLTKLIEECGGLVYSSVNDIDGYTVVLVKDESLHWAYTGPVFKVSYIAACIEATKVIDIGPFFKSSIKTKFTKNFDFMNVIYFKKNTWNDVPSASLSPAKMYNKSANESRNCENDSDSDVPLIVEETKKKNAAAKKYISKHSRLPYSVKEDEDIVKYIVKKNGYDNLRGNVLWKQMEKKDVCPCRTWQSMKEHFRKKIVYNLNSYKFISDNQKHLLQKSCL